MGGVSDQEFVVRQEDRVDQAIVGIDFGQWHLGLVVVVGVERVVTDGVGELRDTKMDSPELWRSMTP